jgi:hypothetical protein
VVGGRGLCLAAARAHPANSGQPVRWPAAAKGVTSLAWSARWPPERVGSAKHGCGRGGGLSWAAGMGQADLAARGQGPVSLPRFLAEEAAAVGGLQQPSVDLAVVERSGGDQVVEVAGRLPQLPVAVADGSGGDPGELLGQGRPGIAVAQVDAGGRKLSGPTDRCGHRRSSRARNGAGTSASRVSRSRPPAHW